MSEPFSTKDIVAISLALSEPRLGRYVVASHRNRRRALALYRWNAEASAALFVPMSLCEVVLRNAIVEAIEHVYGPNWSARGSAFERSLPRPKVGYSPFADLESVRARYAHVGKLIPELKFMFWVSMLTSRYDRRVWTSLIKTVFPNLPARMPALTARRLLHSQVNSIRIVRNRIAHHEPIFQRNLTADYRRCRSIVSWRSNETARWLDSMERITHVTTEKP